MERKWSVLYKYCTFFLRSKFFVSGAKHNSTRKMVITTRSQSGKPDNTATKSEYSLTAFTRHAPAAQPVPSTTFTAPVLSTQSVAETTNQHPSSETIAESVAGRIGSLMKQKKEAGKGQIKKSRKGKKKKTIRMTFGNAKRHWFERWDLLQGYRSHVCRNKKTSFRQSTTSWIR